MGGSSTPRPPLWDSEKTILVHDPLQEKNSSVPGRLGGASMRTLAHQSVVCEVPTRFVISAYSNRVMVVVTQADNMGTLVSTAAKASARLAGR